MPASSFYVVAFSGRFACFLRAGWSVGRLGDPFFSSSSWIGAIWPVGAVCSYSGCLPMTYCASLFLVRISFLLVALMLAASAYDCSSGSMNSGRRSPLASTVRLVTWDSLGCITNLGALSSSSLEGGVPI